jgi:hypothetical protein
LSKFLNYFSASYEFLLNKEQSSLTNLHTT